MYFIIRLIYFIITIYVRMADSILYSLYLKSGFHKTKENVIDIEAGNFDKNFNIKKVNRLYEPNNRHSMYIDNVSVISLILTFFFFCSISCNDNNLHLSYFHYRKMITLLSRISIVKVIDH